MVVESQGRRYVSLAHHERGEAMSPRELVEDVIRRKADGSLTFRIDEDEYSVAANLFCDGWRYTHAWSKQALADDATTADLGLRVLLAKTNPRREGSPE